MTEIEIGGTAYRLYALQAGGHWVARAFTLDSNERFGVDVTGPTEAAAVRQLREWLEWHHEHVSALEVLRQAERAYHRAVTDRAFARPDSDAQDTGKRLLEEVDRARAALDAVRARRPVL